MDKHYAIVKRIKKIVIPYYQENHSAFGSNKIIVENYKPSEIIYSEKENKIIKYNNLLRYQKFNINEVSHFGMGLSEFKRVIANTVEEQFEITYWEGIIKQLPLIIGEKLEINNEVFEIKDVVKNIDGLIEYKIEAMFEAHENYDELFEECNKKFEAFTEVNIDMKNEVYLESPKFEKKLNWYQKLMKYVKKRGE